MQLARSLPSTFYETLQGEALGHAIGHQQLHVVVNSRTHTHGWDYNQIGERVITGITVGQVGERLEAARPDRKYQCRLAGDQIKGYLIGTC